MEIKCENVTLLANKGLTNVSKKALSGAP